MSNLKFNFRPLNIQAIYGHNNVDTFPAVFETDKRGSNKFIMCYMSLDVDKENWFESNYYGPRVADRCGIVRDNYIIKSLPKPEMTIQDYKDIITDIKNKGYKIDKNSYVVYEVDLLYSVMNYEIIQANNVSDARNIAKDILSQSLNEKVLIKNLMVDPVKNSILTYVSNLSNSYVGICGHGYNNYFTFDRYLVGIFRPGMDLNKCKQYIDWLKYKHKYS